MPAPKPKHQKPRSLVEAVSDGIRLDALSDWLFRDSDRLVADTPFESTAPLVFPNSAPGLPGSDLGFQDEVGSLLLQADSPFGFDLATESFTTQDGDIPRSRGAEKEVVFSYEDWEQEEQLAVHLLTHNVRNAFKSTLSKKLRQKSLDFVFANLAEDTEVDFVTCCEILQVREHVMKTRIHFEFFMRWMIVEDMPFLNLPCNEDLLSEVAFKAGFTGVEISKLAWSWPGVTLQQMLDRLSAVYPENDLLNALGRITKSGHISIRGENLYFTGRNPNPAATQEILRNSKKSNFRWSRLWG